MGIFSNYMGKLVTPQEEHKDLAKAIYQEFSGKKVTEAPFRLFLKREDLHPYGSHKGRSIPHMIDLWMSKGVNRFAISSSGNAALAAVLYLKELKVATELYIYCGLNITLNKLAKLEKHSERLDWIRIRKVARPLQELNIALERENFGSTGEIKLASLRQSTDEAAVEGYSGLVDELKQIPDLAQVFIGTSSGTTATALASGLPCAVNIIQTTYCHPIADILGADLPAMESDDEAGGTSTRSLADAIVDKIAVRSKTLVPLIKKNDGKSYIATDALITKAQRIVHENAELSISANSALSIAGLTEMIYSGETPSGSVICMICGD